ncbi:SURF1 family protein [Dokdonella koreensis]|uniref:SURF1-like protein n=1 Tax=Dokdonella koreensis DS-123 TaxID=1300342 RepID=A0A160DX57_9GAMM|nr:SURF1 family protein [Dokdonella koreensis]ANB19084.1 SURF1 domain containing protein [Dokdonella koreensis DS-123]
MNRRWHRPGWFAVALTLCGVALFSSLGSWQLRRAAEKEQLLAAFARTAQTAPVSLSEARRTASTQHFPHVRVEGRFDTAHAYLLDDQIRGQRTGVILYGVFEPLGGGPALLVNRGFLPRREDREMPVPAAETGPVALSGLYAPVPGSGLRLGGNALPGQTTWPKKTIYLDTDEIAADIGRALDDRVLLLDPDPASGFERIWTPELMPPERHRGYAFQWFSFVVAALAIFTLLHWRKESS